MSATTAAHTKKRTMVKLSGLIYSHLLVGGLLLGQPIFILLLLLLLLLQTAVTEC